MSKNVDGSEKKIQILQALDNCLQKKPFDRTSIKDIAREAGVNHGLLHYYFKNKEDILINYIDYVMETYKQVLDDWLTSNIIPDMDAKRLIEEFFKFMNERITLNRTLSAVFIEIWEIALYNANVRKRLQQSYRGWIGILTDILAIVTGNVEPARKIAIAAIAFFEGMALFSILLDGDASDLDQILDGFRKNILTMADLHQGSQKV